MTKGLDVMTLANARLLPSPITNRIQTLLARKHVETELLILFPLSVLQRDVSSQLMVAETTAVIQIDAYLGMAIPVQTSIFVKNVEMVD